jgi:hypothetical protein
MERGFCQAHGKTRDGGTWHYQSFLSKFAAIYQALAALPGARASD